MFDDPSIYCYYLAYMLGQDDRVLLHNSYEDAGFISRWASYSNKCSKKMKYLSVIRACTVSWSAANF